MTHQDNYSGIHSAVEQVIEFGLDGLDSAVAILINEAMHIERSKVLGANPWQRSDSRQGYANGYQTKKGTFLIY